MKKTIILVAILATLVSCTQQAPQAVLKTEIDSLSYALGMNNSIGLLAHMAQQGIDTTYMNEFFKGFNEGANKTTEKDKAYFEGIQMGHTAAKTWTQNFNGQFFGEDSTKTINTVNLLAGFIAGLKNDTTKMALEFASEYATTAIRRTQEEMQEKMRLEMFGDNKEAGERFLADNKAKEGIQVTESGLQYRVIRKGRGATPVETDRVKVHYSGTLIDGTEFDSSFKRNAPLVFAVNRLIAGWTEALTMMPVGSKWELYIPQELAYGARESGPIKPFSALIFEVELIGIEE